MALANEWQITIDAFLAALHERITRPLAELKVRYFTTFEHLSPEQAAGKAFSPIQPGTEWGKDFEYAWFAAEVDVPALGEGKAVALVVKSGNEHTETTVWSAGKALGGLDYFHRQIELSPGKHQLIMESYAGHRFPGCSYQFAVPGKDPLGPEKPARQKFESIRLVEWNEQAFQLWMDATVVRQLTKHLPGDTLRMAKLEKAIKDAVCRLDLEAPQEQFEAAIPQARQALAGVLAAHNGSTAPTMHCFGHAHIDIAWLWPLAQTYRKNAHTFSTSLALMDRYKEYKFLQSQGQLYDYLKRQYPEIYERIKQAVARGQWIPDGAMWVESDTNVTGGESLIRQFLFGRRFFKQEFNFDSEVCWLPDVFGYSANMPQILRGCGVKYFSTQKIFWNYHGGTTFPYETFTWEGIDGSTLLAHIHRDYNAPTDPAHLAQRWKDCVQKEAGDILAYPFGWGDGGGGPTREHLEFLRREADLEGLPKTRIGSLREFFAELEKLGPPAERYVGELYFEAHRGTYSSQVNVKKGNRKCEFALREAEMWSALAGRDGRFAYPAAKLEECWKKVLLNQFHDVLPGSSIGRVYKEAKALHDEVLQDATEMASVARRSMLESSKSFTVFNSLAWSRDALVELPGQGRVIGEDGEFPCQAIAGNKTLAMIHIGPCGAASLELKSGKPAKIDEEMAVSAGKTADGITLDNSFILATINAAGEISSLIDKFSGRQLVAPGEAANKLQLFRDNPAWFDAWDIDAAYRLMPVEIAPAQSVQIVHSGPLEARVRVQRTVGQSTLSQDIVLRAGSRRIDFETRVDWQEQHRLLKAAFPSTLRSPTLRGEIQFGHVVRPTHRNTEFEKQRFEWPAQKWADVSEAEIGLAVLNDCRYGYDMLEGHLRLTLLRAPMAPDEKGDRGVHEFTYSLLLHGGFNNGDAIRAAYELNAPASVEPGELADGDVEFLHFEDAELPPIEADFPEAREIMQGLDEPDDIVVETIKAAEDGKGIIVRAYESTGASRSVLFRPNMPCERAWLCNLIEQEPVKVAVEDGAISLAFAPFEIKTIRLE